MALRPNLVFLPLDFEEDLTLADHERVFFTFPQQTFAL